MRQRKTLALFALTELFLDNGMGLLGTAVANLSLDALDKQPDLAGFPAAKCTNT